MSLSPDARTASFESLPPPRCSVKLKSPALLLFGQVHIRTPLAQTLVDTRLFQRCKSINQLQNTHYVYPSATHRRFEHQLDCYHCTNLWLDHLFEQQPELHAQCDARHRELIAVAALLHDVGHCGPLAHSIDKHVFPLLGLPENTHHERRSVQGVQYLADEVLPRRARECGDPSVALSPEETRFVCSVIMGDPIEGMARWMFQLVASYNNEVDSDRLVYLNRDALAVGFRHSIDIPRLLRNTRVIDGNVCFCSKAANEVYNVFHLRYQMHANVYQHHAVTSVDLVMRDILVCLGQALRWKHKVERGPRGWMELTDDLVQGLLNASEPLQLPDATEQEKLWFARAQRLAEDRLYCRRFYQQIHACTLSAAELRDRDVARVPEELQRLYPTRRIHVMKCVLGFSYNDTNPLDRIRYYDRARPDVAFPIAREERSKMISSDYAETKLCYFVAPPGNEEIDEAIHALDRERERRAQALASSPSPSSFSSSTTSAEDAKELVPETPCEKAQQSPAPFVISQSPVKPLLVNARGSLVHVRPQRQLSVPDLSRYDVYTESLSLDAAHPDEQPQPDDSASKRQKL